ncbi:MAG: insulinase family protein, partial [Butyrivibrio sp.]|nr:insulinase family protein [Butyrivibrio sp.]
MIMLMMKHDAMSREMKGSIMKPVNDYLNAAVSSMFNSRIEEILQQPNPPFIGAGMEDGEFFVAKTKDAVTGMVQFKDNGQDEALEALYREMLRVARFGFTESEYDRFKQEYLSRLEDRYAKKDKVQSTQYVNQCVRHFLDGDAMPGIEMEHQLMPVLVEQLSVDVINESLKESVSENDSNLVVVMFAPEKEDVILPTKQQLLAVLKKVQTEDITAYVEEVNNDPLISEELKGSKAKSVKDGPFDSKVITLGNGVVVHFKQTDFTPNSVSMIAQSWGGISYYNGADDILNAGNIDELTLGGLGSFSATDLKKRLAGVQANVSPFVDQRREGLRGGCVVKDFETMLQLTYLNFTSLRRDNEAFSSFAERTRQRLQNADLAPTTALSDTLISVIYNNNIRAKRMKADDVDRLNYDRMLKIYNERFADGNDFEFFFVGDITLEEALPLFEKYLGSLPVLSSSEKQKSIDLSMRNGEMTNVFEKELQTPTAIVVFVYHAPMKTNLKNTLMVDMLQQLMSMLYTESVREDEGGAYGVPVQGTLSDYPEEIAQMIIQLPTAPDKRERMTEIVYKGIEDICKDGPSAENLQKVKEYLHRKHAEDLKKNEYWMNAIMNDAL